MAAINKPQKVTEDREKKKHRKFYVICHLHKVLIVGSDEVNEHKNHAETAGHIEYN